MNDIWRNRMIYIVLWGLSILGITFYGGVISYGLFAMLTLLPMVSLLYVGYVLYRFKIYQEMGARWVQVNQRVPFYFSLVNEDPIGFAGLRVSYYSSFSQIVGLDDAIEYELLPGHRVHKESELICKYRGNYLVGIKEIEAWDFFRLIHICYQNREPLKAVVRPQIVMLDQLNCIDNLATVTREHDMADSIPDVLVRRYEPGDDPKQMNWKVSARQHELMIRKRIGERQQGICILFTTYRREEEEKMYLPPENKVLETVLALALFYAQQRIPSRTYYMQASLECLTLSGVDTFERYYEGISGVEFHRSYKPQRLLATLRNERELFSSKLVIFVVYEMTEIGGQLVQALAEHGVYVLLCMVRNHEQVSGLDGIPNVRIVTIPTDRALQEVL